MFIAVSPYINPEDNLALEEYLLTQETEEGILLWRNDKSVIIGRNQNIVKEIVPNACKEYHCKVVRRSTGGGAVYHDLGNINFSLFYKNQKQENTFLQTLLAFLEAQGLHAELSGRNDILISGRKVSGMAKLEREEKILLHGTLLYDVDFRIMEKVLRVSSEKLRAKGIESVQSRVGNIKNLCGSSLSAKQWMDELYETLKTKMKCISWSFRSDKVCQEEEKVFIFTYAGRRDVGREIKRYKRQKYANEDWNYKRNDDFEYKAKKRFSVGEISLEMSVEHFKIKKCRFTGDFIGGKPVNKLEKLLEGTVYEEAALQSVLSAADISQYFSALFDKSKKSLSAEELLCLLMEPMKERKDRKNEN